MNVNMVINSPAFGCYTTMARQLYRVFPSIHLRPAVSRCSYRSSHHRQTTAATTRRTEYLRTISYNYCNIAYSRSAINSRNRITLSCTPSLVDSVPRRHYLHTNVVGDGGDGKYHSEKQSDCRDVDNTVNLQKTLLDYSHSADIDIEDLRMLQLLALYQQRYGDCHVPTGQSSAIRREREFLLESKDDNMLNKDSTIEDDRSPYFNLETLEELADWLEKRRRRFRQVTRSRKKNNNGRSVSNRSRAGDTLTVFSVLESIGVIWSAREAQWQRYFNRLVALSSRNTTSDRNNNSMTDSDYLNQLKRQDLGLWQWSDRQRKLHQQGRLSKEREDLLRDAGFLFDLYEARWLEQYEKLCQHIADHDGDSLIPIDYEDHPSLSKWVSHQRHTYSEGRLPQHRVDALNSIDFIWNPYQEIWNRHYDDLCSFVEEHGHTRVPQSAGRLFTWVCHQRKLLRQYTTSRKAKTIDDDDHVHDEDLRRTDNRLNAGDAKKLADLGVHPVEEKDEGEEVYNGKHDVDDEGLTEEEIRARRLLDLTLEPVVHDVNWMKNFEELCTFHAKFGHFVVPRNPLENYTELSNWSRHQRYLYKANRLPKERAEALEKIGFPWTATQARWEKMYEEFCRFHTEYGHSRVPVKKVDLYRWTSQQRKIVSNLGQKGTDERSFQKLLRLKEILSEDT
mmetsp:Transcript_41440/g.99267  ORF Transcript_41440/g.99267 Transcript_41440/m.99267 type:complete len:676 (+) Transcript_41440:228-2255(+)